MGLKNGFCRNGAGVCVGSNVAHRSVGLDFFLVGSQLLSFQRAAILPQEKLLKETQALDCCNTHCILCLVLSWPRGDEFPGMVPMSSIPHRPRWRCLTAKEPPHCSVCPLSWQRGRKFHYFNSLGWSFSRYTLSNPRIPISKMGNLTYHVLSWGSRIFEQIAWWLGPWWTTSLGTQHLSLPPASPGLPHL